MRMLFKGLLEHIEKKIISISYTTALNEEDSITITFEDKAQVIIKGGMFAKSVDPPLKIQTKFYEN